MARSAYLVYVRHGIAGAALELIRRLCEPRSTSIPHVTVRYSTRALEESATRWYENVRVENLTVVEPATFDADGELNLRTVILRCRSDFLESFAYKPDYPDSFLHVTLYEGKPSSFAYLVLEALRRYPWNLDLDLGGAGLVQYAKSPPRLLDGVQLSDEANELLRDLSPPGVDPMRIFFSDDESRLRLIDRLCAVVHQNSPEAAGASRDATDSRRVEDLPIFEPTNQQSFWSEDEVRALHIGENRKVSLKELRATGTFATPPELALDVVRAATAELDPSLPISFGDPALGSGIFFASLLAQIDRSRLASALGVESNRSRAQLTARRWSESNLKVVSADFLTVRPVGDPWTLVAANPPYVRYQDQDPRAMAVLRADLSSRLHLDIDGRADLYVYFVLASHDWMASGGVAAWLLPSEFLETRYGRTLRTYLRGNVRLIALHTYERQISRFDNARVSSTLVLFAKEAATESANVRVSVGGSYEAPEQVQEVPLDSLAPALKWSWANIVPSGSALSLNRVPLSELFRIRRGIATGANAQFVLNDEDLERLDVRPEWVTPVLPKSRLLKTATIEGDELGNPVVDDPRWLINTSESLERIESESPTFASYLRQVHAEVGTRNLVAQRKLFYKQEERPAPNFVFIYMAKRDAVPFRRFILNRSRAVVLNNYLGLEALPHLSEAMLAVDGRDSQLLSALAAITADEMERRGRSYISGLLKLEPSELRGLKVDLTELGWVTDLIRLGKDPAD